MQRRVAFSAVSLIVLAAAVSAHAADVANGAPAPAADESEVSKVIVTAAPYGVSADALTASVAVVDRTQLDLAPPKGLGDALAGLPGVRSTAFGAGASRPVVRGLAGPRVQVLTNGVGQIDASALSPDHQVATDPGEAERIEVLRGPAALAYGGSAIGGVVNIIDDRIASRQPTDGLSGRLLGSAGTGDNSYALSGAVHATVGPFVLSLDAMKRNSKDYKIPVYPESKRLLASEGETAEGGGGKLENSAVDLETFGAGLSYVGDKGYVGMSIKRTDSRYGVPGHAHEGGDDHDHDDHDHDHAEEAPVTIGLRQTRIDLRGEYDLDLGPFSKVQFSGGHADYTHTEFEGDAVGTKFTSDGYEGRLELVQAERGGWKGAVGVQALRRNFDAVGDEAYVPKTKITEFGAFTQQRLELDNGYGVEGGLRIDTRELDSLKGKADFTNLSGSVGAFWRPTTGSFIGLALSRTSRAPTESELFAEGPHAATRGFEVGDANLKEEVATSVEATFHYSNDRLSGDLHLFAARYDGFIDLRPTGAEADGMAVYNYTQTDADFHGLEAELTYRVWSEGQRSVSLQGGADYVRGSSDLGPPARIPPYAVSLKALYEGPMWSGNVEVRRTGGQDRVAELELPSDGYTTLNASLAWKPTGDARLRLFLDGRNLTNAEVREHVSFLKDIAPSPGRQVRAGIALRF
ncbi:TonB-dependent receptor [Caulobacter sp. RHG1]|uniref:TonB-dependent receptor n=1 Tax=Caulobacter sp. (strain RHG1) TaxID=2545762 RepID=UPI0015576880|nr:TonB-dependent receptor [Caulobacter sp. RHG1]NQE61987.1 Zinc-regulated outer membrane receptor [Caulobacter sp. RHG1]